MAKRLIVPPSDSFVTGGATPEMMAFANDIARFRQQVAERSDFISGLIMFPEDTDYRLIVNIPSGKVIESTTTKSGSGTCTATFKINSTALGGTANSVSTTEQTQSHSSENEMAEGDDLVLTVSSNSSCEKLSFTVKLVDA